MSAAQEIRTQSGANPTPWWKEPTKDQWLAFGAAWMGWTLDASDFTMFLLIMVPISQDDSALHDAYETVVAAAKRMAAGPSN